MSLRDSRLHSAIVMLALLALLASTAASANAGKRPRPRVSVTAWSTEPLGSSSTVAPGGTLKLCGPLGASTVKIYAYLKFRNMREGRKFTIKWTHNGLLYATVEQRWSLRSRGRGAAEMVRAPSQLEFPTGLYRFSLKYGGRRIGTSTLTISSDC